MSASSLFSRLPACGENTSGKPSSACFFHCAICVGWTPYSAAISLAVFCPLIASKATRVFSSALYRFRCTDIVFLLLAGFSIQLFYLIDLSSFLVPSYIVSWKIFITNEDGLYLFGLERFSLICHTCLLLSHFLSSCDKARSLPEYNTILQDSFVKVNAPLVSSPCTFIPVLIMR